MSVTSEVPRLSPCIGICKLDERTGYCLGCGRTGDEIGAWGGLDPASQDEIWAMLPERLAALSVRIRLLPLMDSELAGWVAETIREAKGRWVTGVPGAVAEFPCQTCDADVSLEGEAVVARMADARFRLRLHEKLRAFAFDGNGPVVLGLPKRRAMLPLAEGFTPLGADADAIAPEDRADELFDFGLGHPAHRFCIRTGDPDFIGTLRESTGKSWADVMAQLGQQIVQKSPVRVVESALARIEVSSPIPRPGGSLPGGPHTKLVPRLLAAGDDGPEALKIPDHASPVAIFYPGNRRPEPSRR